MRIRAPKKNWTMLLLLLACIPAHSAKWEKIYEDQVRIIFMDHESVRQTRGDAKVWFRSTFKEKQKFSAIGTYQSSMKHKIYDCESSVAVTDKIILYEKADWAGRIIFQKTYGGNQYEEFDVFPPLVHDDSRARLLRKICPAL